MWLIGILVFAWCFWGAYVLVTQIMGSRFAISERLTYYTQMASRSVPASGRWSDIPAADRMMSRLGFSRSIELLLDQADLPLKAFEFVLMIIVSGLGMGVVGLFTGRGHELVTAKLARVSLMIISGGFIPFAWVHIRRGRRRHAFTRQLPEALQAISSALRAGFGFSHGMAIVASDLPAPVSVEFARAQREMNLGLTVEEVLQNMGKRMQSPDFDLAVSGIMINRQVGGNLAELLDHIVATLRERVKLKNFIRVLTAQQRLSAWIIVAVPPVLLIVLFLGMRQYTSYLLATRIGQIMLVLALCMQFLGGFLIRRIVSIDV